MLEGVKVLDFTTLLPGPLATAMLVQAGAEVIKVERLDGDAYRSDPAAFALLNAGKRSIAIDLKRDCARLEPLLATCDVLIEQFRPGVMDRLGLGAEALRARRSTLIYVSINGYGSSGPDAGRPGHDLTYQAESGLLSLNADAAGDPVMPSAMVADFAAGQSAFANILLALLARQKTEEGARIEIPMLGAVLPFLVEPIAHSSTGSNPGPRYSPATGSSPRYGVYRCADGRHLALASPEEKFWQAFLARTGLAVDAGRAEVTARLGERSAGEWLAVFAGADLCCSEVLSMGEALATPRIRALLDDKLLPLGIAAPFVALRATDVPTLGEANDLLG